MHPLRLLVAAFLVLAWSAASHAADVSRAESAAIGKVVRAQLEAFARRDAQRAFSYATPEVQREFGDAQTFMAVVTREFAILVAPRTTTFLPVARIGEDIVQAVRVVGRDGETMVALYFMERQKNGAWRIGGCELAPSEVQSI